MSAVTKPAPPPQMRSRRVTPGDLGEQLQVPNSIRSPPTVSENSIPVPLTSIATLQAVCDNFLMVDPASPGRVPGFLREKPGRPAMTTDGQFAFGRFRFDARTGELWRNRMEAKLAP